MISHTFLRILPKQNTAVLAHVSQLVELGKPTCKKSEVFLNIVQKAFDPPPFYLNICPILQGVFFERVFEHLI